jgi:hypothetical protein
MDNMNDYPLIGVGWIFKILSRSILVIIMISVIIFACYMLVEGAQPMVYGGKDKQGQPIILSTGSTAALQHMSYWDYMADRLAASKNTPSVCQQTRVIYLAIALPLYPALYTYVALYPKSAIARHIQPSPLIPKQITWIQAPATWWNLVKEISILAFTQPQWNYTPAVGQRVQIDRRCVLPIIKLESAK